MFKISDTVVHPGMSVCKAVTVHIIFYLLKNCTSKSYAGNKQESDCVFLMKKFFVKPKS